MAAILKYETAQDYKIKKRKDKKRDNQMRAFVFRSLSAMGYLIVEEVTDKERQVLGIDVIVSPKDNPQKLMNVDIKCSDSPTYMEVRRLDTFLQELEFTCLDQYDNKVRHCGWGNDDSLLTTHQLLCIPRGKVVDGKITSVTEMRTYMVSKEKIKEYYKEFGYTVDEVLDIYHANKDKASVSPNGVRRLFLSKKNADGGYEVKSYCDKSEILNYIKVVESANLFESPINVPIPLPIIEKLAEAKIYQKYTPEASDQLLKLANSPTLIEKCNQKCLTKHTI